MCPILHEASENYIFYFHGCLIILVLIITLDQTWAFKGGGAHLAH